MEVHYLAGHHDPGLVVLSVVIAVFASFTALELAGRMKVATGVAHRVWLAASAVCLGGGIWSMHFVAMLAFNLDRSIVYDLETTIASLLVAILVTGFGLAMVSRRPAHGLNLLFAGTLTGLGIAGMHYTGMAAMQMAAAIVYDPVLVAASIAIAIGAATAALWLAFSVDRAWEKMTAGIVMGAAIAGMHYTAMHAATFLPAAEAAAPRAAVAIPLLAAVIAVATFGILFLGLVSSAADRRFAAQVTREAEALRRSEARFRAILDTANEAFIAIDADDRITFWNSQAETTFGLLRHQAIGRTLAETIIPERYREAHRQGLQRLLTTGKHKVLNQLIELTAVHASGREFPVEFTVTALRREGSWSFNAFLRDISQRKQVERDLISAKEQAEAASRAKSLFLANMSHELRTPLNAVIGFSELIVEQARGPIENPHYREYATDIMRSGQHLLALINDILDASRAETGQLPLHEQPFNVLALLEEVTTALHSATLQAGVDLVLPTRIDLPWLHADPQRIRQVFTHLLSNAVKFSQPGGRVDVVIDRPRDGSLIFTVSDSGIGMTAEQIQIALIPFGQVESQLSRRYGGAGLGLPLSKQILDLHQAGLTIHSTPGAGTRVRVTFPPARVRHQPVAAAD